MKGTHIAIDVAKKSGSRLVIAGNVSQGHEPYFKEFVQPHVDGDQIVYLGPVDDSQKNQWLGKSRALLMPILWEEPFGIVMAEALACGTPVIAFRRGAVPEIVEGGVNGFICNTADEMTVAVNKVDSIDRRNCRLTAERKFSDQVIVSEYERLYYSLLDKRSG